MHRINVKCIKYHLRIFISFKGCTVCEKRFADRYYLKVHMRLHVRHSFSQTKTYSEFFYYISFRRVKNHSNAIFVKGASRNPAVCQRTRKFAPIKHTTIHRLISIVCWIRWSFISGVLFQNWLHVRGSSFHNFLLVVHNWIYEINIIHKNQLVSSFIWNLFRYHILRILKGEVRLGARGLANHWIDHKIVSCKIVVQVFVQAQELGRVLNHSFNSFDFEL